MVQGRTPCWFVLLAIVLEGSKGVHAAKASRATSAPSRANADLPANSSVQPGVDAATRATVWASLRDNSVSVFIPNHCDSTATNDNSPAWSPVYQVPAQESKGSAFIALINVKANYLAFAQPKRDQTMTVKTAGTVAACYCGMVAGSACLNFKYWLFLGLMPIRGPAGGQAWLLPTRTVVRLSDISGWAFDPADKLRILASTATACTDNVNQPEGSVDYQVGCPVDNRPSSRCRPAKYDELIGVSLAGSLSTNMYINSVQVEGAGSSVLTFSGPITKYLNDGDVITISRSAISIGGNWFSSMTQAEKYDASILAGISNFQDIAGGTFFQDWQLVRRLSRVEDGCAPGSRPSAKLRIPVGWNSDLPGGIPDFSFTRPDGENQWLRRNTMSTGRELRADVARQQLLVCWAPLDASRNSFYSPAGVVTFFDPSPMPVATVSLVTRQAGTIAPAIVSFSTNRQLQVYERVMGEMVLTLRFRGENLTMASTSGGTFAASSAVDLENATQALCGQLFLEMWSNDPRGFPMPRACYYGPLGAGGVANARGVLTERDIYIVFDRFNGLRNWCNTGVEHVCTYQLVLQVAAALVAPDQQVIDIYTGCRYEGGGCTQEFEFYERGEAGFSSGTIQGAGTNDGRLDPATGLQLQAVDTNKVVVLAPGKASLQAKLTASRDSPGVNRSSILRLFLAPLTQWNLGPAPCIAQCFYTTPAPCAECTTESVVAAKGEKYNVLRLRLPLNMDSIAGGLTHTVRVSGLALPASAIFPTQVGVQLTNQVDLAPQFLVSVGAVAFLSAPAADAQLVITGTTGNGPMPFPGDTNLLYVRLQFAATLWAQGDSGGQINLQPPRGYTCSVEGLARVPHFFEDKATWSNYALLRRADAFYNNTIQTLFLLDRDLDDHPDFPRGSLAVAPSGGSWSTSSVQPGDCGYTLQSGQALFAGQVVYVALTLRNPAELLDNMDANNVWAVTLRGRGSAIAGMYLAPASSFNDANEANFFAVNAAVLGRLTGTLLQPETFIPGASQKLSIFFRTVQQVRRGEVVIDAPSGFGFGQACYAEPIINVFSWDAPDAVHALPNILDCIATPATDSIGLGSNRAHVRFNGTLDAGQSYALRLNVSNIDVTSPYFGAVAAGGSWYLWTVDVLGNFVDGSPAPVAFALGQTGSWVLYDALWSVTPLLGVRGGLLRPYRTFREPAVLVVSGMTAPSTFGKRRTSVRVIAPPSCLFQDLSTGNFRPSADGSTALMPSTPLLGADGGSLLWPSVHLSAIHIYGFEASMEVQEALQQFGLHAFILEVGYAATDVTQRVGAIVVPAPPLKAIAAAPVGYLTSRAGYQRNVFTFRFRLASPVPPGGDAVLVIQGDEAMYGASLGCSAGDASTAIARLPAGVSCAASSDEFGSPRLVLTPGASPIEAGEYTLEVQGCNPTKASKVPANWTIKTLLNTSTVAGGRLLDAPAEAQGFLVRDGMAVAVVDWAGAGALYDGRLGRWSAAVLRWRLASSPGDPLGYVPAFYVHAPTGFMFQEDCSSSIQASRGPSVTLSTRVLAQDALLPPLEACSGDGAQAAILWLRELSRNETYSMLIRFLSPMRLPSLNSWSLEYGAYTSSPLSGYPLAVVAFPAPPSATSTSAGPRGVAPVSVYFILSTAVPRGGRLRLTAPPGFVVYNLSALQPRHTTTLEALTLGQDLPSSISSGAELSVLLESVGIPAGVPYWLQVLVSNPPSVLDEVNVWSMATLNISGDPLDDGMVSGYPLSPAMRLEVTNTGSNFYSLDEVTIGVLLLSPVDLRFDDILRLEAPDGLILLGAKPPMCTGFLWTQWPSRAPQPVPVCSCAFGPCVLSMTFNADAVVRSLLKGVVSNSTQSLSFRLRSSNTARDPDLDQQYWRVTHLRPLPGGALLSVATAALRSWHIQPVLQGCAVELVGASRAAGAESSMLVTFTPVSYADVLWLVAEFPRQVSFDRAEVDAPRRKDNRTRAANLIISNLQLTSGLQVSLRINQVQLGRGGGQSVFTLATYRDLSLSEKIDELVSFPGFYQPGLADSSGTLVGLYALSDRASTTDRVRAAMPARAGEEAEATFSISFSFPLQFGNHLVLSCEGEGAYTFLMTVPPRLFLVTPAGSTKDAILLQVATRSEHSLDFVLRRGPKSTSNSTVALEAGQAAQLLVRLLPTLGVNTWRFETYDGQQQTNTNDGKSAGFRPVARLMMTIQAQRAPPDATVEVQLKVSAMDGPDSTVFAPELLLVAPPGFSFPVVCGDICTSRGETFGSTGLATAILTASDSTSLVGQLLSFRTITPSFTPFTLIWVVEARALGSTPAGWGSAETFKVNQMRDAAVYYGGIPNAKVVLAFTFTLLTDPGEQQLFTIIEVTAPASFVLSCQRGDLEQISLPGGLPACDKDGAGALRIVLNQTLRIGSYAFAAKVTLPSTSPAAPPFSIMIRDHGTQSVMDAAFNVPGWPLVNLPVMQPTLAWSTAGYAGVSSVTVGMTFKNFTDSLLMIVISLPGGFTHRVRTVADFKSSNNMIPLLKGGVDWLDQTDTGRLRILLEPTNPMVAAGSYRFAFPVNMPQSPSLVAQINLWQVVMSQDRTGLEPGDPSVLATFAMAGFMPGQVSALEAQRLTAALADVANRATSSWSSPAMAGFAAATMWLLLFRLWSSGH